MESDPGREGCPIALQTSDAWEAAVAGEAQMTWLTWRHVQLFQLLRSDCKNRAGTGGVAAGQGGVWGHAPLSSGPMDARPGAWTGPAG